MLPRIEYALPPLTEELKQHLEKNLGLRPFAQFAGPKFTDSHTDNCISFI